MGDATQLGGAAGQDLRFYPDTGFEARTSDGYSWHAPGSGAEGEEPTRIIFWRRCFKVKIIF
jgi:hypothetical protein